MTVNVQPASAGGRNDLETVFPGNGEMARRCREFDWATTPLGPVSTWSLSLRATVRLVLASGSPMLIFWGPELTQIYNDAFLPSFGPNGRHPRVLGVPATECWNDVWHIVGPEIAGV